MKLAQNLIQGGAGGVLTGALLGLAEALFHLASSGMPDLLAPFYAVVLYGLLGLPFGLGAGLVAFGVHQWLRDLSEGQSWAFGACGALTPLAAFILRYLANKVVFAEAGVPLTAMLGILALIGVVDLLLLFGVSRLLDGPGKRLLKASGFAGSWATLALLTGGVALLPVGDDPRANWDSNKGIPEAVAKAPNVLVIMVDTLRADHLGSYGSSLATPTVDALAADGIVFEQAIAGASWTRSAGASIFTSRIPSGHNGGLKASRLPEGNVLFSEALQQGGYTTGALINNINLTSTFGFDQGWDSFFYESPDYPYFGTEGVFSLTMYKVVHKLSERIFKANKQVNTFYQPAEVVLGDAKDFISANKANRWALFVHLMEPHDPYFEHPRIDGSGGATYNGVGYARAEHEHPDPAKAEYLAKVYNDEVVWLDQELAPFLAWLKSSGHYDNTLIVFTADHGEEFNEHGGFWHGTTLYDEQIHVPLIVKLPGARFAGTRAPWQVRTIDIAPTLALAAGLPPDPSWQGEELITDVAKELASIDAIKAQRAAALVTNAELEPGAVPVEVPTMPVFDGYAHPHNRPAVSEENFEGNVISAIRRDGVKRIEANAGNPRGLPELEIFDVVADPGETKSLVGSTQLVAGQIPSQLFDDLHDTLALTIKNAAKGASAATETCISGAEFQQLVALGYMSADDKVKLCD